MMRRMGALTAVAVAAVLYVHTAGAQDDAVTRAQMDDPKLRDAIEGLDADLARSVREADLPGMSVGIVYREGLIWEKGYGLADVEKQAKADAKSAYDIGSVTKMFTATMLMQLRDAALLSLDEPIERYLPEFRVQSRFADPRPTTFRQVAAHVSGLPMDYGFDTSVPGEWRQFPAARVLADLPEMEYAQPAYTRIHYSNLGVYLMGQALQRIAGQPFREYVKSQIFDPLGMTSTGWEVTGDMAGHLAVGYEPRTGGEPRRPSPVFVAGDFGPPAGGVRSSVKDLTRFVALQFSQGCAGGTQILGSTTLREMRAPVFLAEDWSTAYGIGWELERVAGHTVAGHGGGGLGFVAEIKLVPDLEFGFIVLINQLTDQHAIARQALASLIPAFEDIQARRTGASAQPLPAGAAEYVGHYVSGLGWSADVRIEVGRLVLVPIDPAGNPRSAWALAPHGGAVFLIESGSGAYDGEKIAFRRDPKTGNVQLTWQQDVLDRKE